VANASTPTLLAPPTILVARQIYVLTKHALMDVIIFLGQKVVLLLTKFVILSASASQWSVAIQVIVPVLVLSMLIVLQNLVRVIVN
jgi:hypothetical protein